MTTAIYMRVSSNSQDTRSQEADLKAFAQNCTGKVRWYVEKKTGTNFDRGEWKRLWDDVLRGEITQLVVWRLDRLGRTAGETIVLLDDLEARRVAFRSIRDGFDPSTPAGRLTRNVLASVAQFETEVRKERQLAGISAAKEAGVKWGGRKPGARNAGMDERLRQGVRLVRQGVPVAAAAKAAQVSRDTLYKELKRLGLR